MAMSNKTSSGVRIRDARKRVGLSEAQAADAIGVSRESYFDLECHEDLYDCLSIRSVCLLSALLNSNPIYLALGVDSNDVVAINPEEIENSLKRYTIEENVTREDVGNRIGWDLPPEEGVPEKICDWNLEELMDVCALLKLCWEGILKHIWVSSEWRSTPAPT